MQQQGSNTDNFDELTWFLPGGRKEASRARWRLLQHSPTVEGVIISKDLGTSATKSSSSNGKLNCESNLKAPVFRTYNQAILGYFKSFSSLSIIRRYKGPVKPSNLKTPFQIFEVSIISQEAVTAFPDV